MKTYTEREFALAQRAAFVRGADYAIAKGWGPNYMPITDAASLYPLPTKQIERPRVVKIRTRHNTMQYRLVNGVIEYTDDNGPWQPSSWFVLRGDKLDVRVNTSTFPGDLLAAALEAIGDLIANPTETVEVEDEG